MSAKVIGSTDDVHEFHYVPEAWCKYWDHISGKELNGDLYEQLEKKSSRWLRRWMFGLCARMFSAWKPPDAGPPRCDGSTSIRVTMLPGM